MIRFINLIKWFVVFLIFAYCIWEYVKKEIVIERLNEKVYDIQSAYYEVVKTSYNSWFLNIDTLKNVSIINIEGKKKKLFDVLIDRKIVFYFSSKMCDVCIEKELKNLKKIGEMIGYADILLISNSVNPRIFKNEEFLPFSENIWMCQKSIYNYKLFEETPVFSLMENSEIKLGYCAPKMTNDIGKMFMKFVNKGM